jgi:hypothetical protein
MMWWLRVRVSKRVSKRVGMWSGVGKKVVKVLCLAGLGMYNSDGTGFGLG